MGSLASPGMREERAVRKILLPREVLLTFSWLSRGEPFLLFAGFMSSPHPPKLERTDHIKASVVGFGCY